MIDEEATHFLFSLDVLGAGVAQPFLITDQLAGKHAEQRVMGFDVLLAQIMRIVGGHQLDAQLLGDPHDLNIDDAVFGGTVILNLQVVVVSEHLLIPAGHITGDLRTPAQNRLGDFTAETGGGDDQPLAVLLEQLLVDAGPGEDSAAAHPPQVTDAGELHQIAVTGGVLGKNHQVIALLLFLLRIVDRTVDHIHLIADDRLEIRALAELQQLDGSVHHTVIRQRNGGHAELPGTLDHGRQLRGAIQKAVVAVVVKWYECHGVSLRPNARSSVRTAQPPPDVVGIREPGWLRDAERARQQPARTGRPPAGDAPHPAHCRSAERRWEGRPG